MRLGDWTAAFLVAGAAHAALLGLVSIDDPGTSDLVSPGSFDQPAVLSISLDDGAGLPAEDVSPDSPHIGLPDAAEPAELTTASQLTAPPVLPREKPAANKQPEAKPKRKAGRKRSSRPSAQASSNSKRRAGAPAQGSVRAYSLKLRRWIERHKRYPREARRKRLEGTVRLWIKIDRNGAVLASRITKGSGMAVLDSATAKLPRRASPFPPIPRDVGKSSFSFSVNLRYALN